MSEHAGTTQTEAIANMHLGLVRPGSAKMNACPVQPACSHYFFLPRICGIMGTGIMHGSDMMKADMAKASATILNFQLFSFLFLAWQLLRTTLVACGITQVCRGLIGGHFRHHAKSTKQWLDSFTIIVHFGGPDVAMGHCDDERKQARVKMGRINYMFHSSPHLSSMFFFSTVVRHWQATCDVRTWRRSLCFQKDVKNYISKVFIVTVMCEQATSNLYHTSIH